MGKIIKGETKSGIKFTLNSDIKEDTRFLLYYVNMFDESVPAIEKGKAIIDILELVFGSREGAAQFMDAVASVHDGVCKTEIMMEELNEMFEALNVKNLKSSHS